LSIGLFGNSPASVLLGLMITTALLSMIMSNTATTAMMIAAVFSFVQGLDEKEPLRKSLLLGIPTAASVGGMGRIIGTPPNAIAVQFLELEGLEINFVEWMLYGFPLAVVFTLLFCTQIVV
jgi:sodium-dependent dicarboxylate transporter 2/3/5